jgi:hypothetical protein
VYVLNRALQVYVRPLRRVARWGGCMAACFSILGLMLSPTASANSISMWPTFECHHYNNNTASITLDKLQVNDDDYLTVWAPMLDRYNGQSWVRVFTGAQQVFADSALGELTESSVTLRVAPNAYYRAWAGIASTDGKGAAIYYAQPIAGAYTNKVCRT